MLLKEIIELSKLRIRNFERVDDGNKTSSENLKKMCAKKQKHTYERYEKSNNFFLSYYHKNTQVLLILSAVIDCELVLHERKLTQVYEKISTIRYVLTSTLICRYYSSTHSWRSLLRCFSPFIAGVH